MWWLDLDPSIEKRRLEPCLRFTVDESLYSRLPQLAPSSPNHLRIRASPLVALEPFLVEITYGSNASTGVDDILQWSTLQASSASHCTKDLAPTCPTKAGPVRILDPMCDSEASCMPIPLIPPPSPLHSEVRGMTRAPDQMQQRGK